MIRTFFALAYPFFWCMFLCLVSPFCNDHQFIGVSKCGNPWKYSGWWRCCCV